MKQRYSQGRYNLKNPEKYIGNHQPAWRSSWELSIMQMCDNHPSIEKWASESIRIPYKNPFTGKMTTYVPDFFISYTDKNNKKHAELWEVKPRKQAIKENVGKSKYDQMHYALNVVKWEAANAFCKQNGIIFRVLTEDDLYVMTGKHK